MGTRSKLLVSRGAAIARLRGAKVEWFQKCRGGR
jgi:hypothetical protein